MKKRAKILSLLLAAVMICGLFAGCGADAGTETKDAANSGSNGNEATDILEVELWSANLAEEELVTRLCEEYNTTIGKEQGIVLKPTFSSETSTMLQLGMENGELPLLTTSGISKAYDNGGWIYPFNLLPGGEEFVAEYRSKIGEDILDRAMAISNVAGADPEDVYNLPYTKWSNGICYNKEMFVEAGIVDENGEAKPPTTWAEFVECAEKLTKDGQYGFVMPAQFTYFATNVLQVSWNTMEDDPVQARFSDMTVDFDAELAFTSLAEIYQKGWCVPGADTIDADPARAYFSQGVAGMILGGSAEIGVFRDQYPCDFEWGFTTLAANDGTSYGNLIGTAGFFRPTIKAMELSEADQKKLMSVIEWLYSDEVAAVYLEEAGNFPLNKNAVEIADMSKVSDVAQDILEATESGRLVIKLEGMYAAVDYENMSGHGLFHDLFLQLCEGEITYEQMDEIITQKYTEGLKKAVEEGTVIPEKFAGIID